MGRGSLPTYARISHIPNILEAYRYLTRRNITVLSSELKMSYHTIRRLCTEYSTPQAKTMAKITEALSFIDKFSWQTWKEYCERALYLEKQVDLDTLGDVEDKMRGLLPDAGVIMPAHIVTECSIDVAQKLHASSQLSKTYSYYLSDLHNEALDFLSIRRGVTKSELLRQFIDGAVGESPEVLEALIRSVSGKIVEVVPPKIEEPETFTVGSASMVLGIPVEEIIVQVAADLPDADLAETTPTNSSPETGLPDQEYLLPQSSDSRLEVDEWRPPVSQLTEHTNLTEEEIADLFNGES
jgi:hypothetical protein